MNDTVLLVPFIRKDHLNGGSASNTVIINPVTNPGFSKLNRPDADLIQSGKGQEFHICSHKNLPLLDPDPETMILTHPKH